MPRPRKDDGEARGLPAWAAAPLDPAQPRTAQAYAVLRRAIINLAFEPGAVIHEQTICDQLGVSRTPLREAILQLQSEDLVTVVPNSGTYVSRIDLQAVFDGQLVRDALEMKLVRLAAARVTPDFSAALDASLREQTDAAAAGDHDRFYDLDEAFHAMIAEFAASERVWRIVNSAKAHLDRVRRLSIPIPRHHDVVIAEHGRIARAVASGDADAAAAAMRIHLERVFTMIRRHLDDRREYFAPGSDAVLARHLDAPDRIRLAPRAIRPRTGRMTRPPPDLPPFAAHWFARRGWSPHPHQLALLAARDAPSTLLIAPTGGGKTLAGFLPSLIALGTDPAPGLHTLYVSPLKALAADIRRNLEAPVAEMGLAIRVEDRTGDTKAAQRARQRTDPPHILLTTPESLALLLSYPEAPKIFGGLSRVIVDEIHAMAESKRGDQLALGLARLQSLAPGLSRVGLSATVEDPPALAAFLGNDARVLLADPGTDPDISMLRTERPPPWAGATGLHNAAEVMQIVRGATTTLIFINTRAQAELFFQALWDENADNLPIGLHHGSLSRDARARVEGAMAAGELRAVVCTGSLDLGIDWGAVDLVIQIGAPKNVKRLVQRIGRANHRYNAPSRAVLAPSNRFEVVECVAALQAVRARDLDGEPRGPGPLDVLCQHILLTACAAPFDADALFAETRKAGPYRDLSRADFDACLDFCATGGYALKAYDRWGRLVLRDGLWSLRDPRATRALRINIGTIVDTETLAVRIKGTFGAPLGEIEESFAATLSPGDTFLIGGQTVRYEGLRDMSVEVTRHPSKTPKIAVFMGTKLATSTRLAERMAALLSDPSAWHALPAHTREWLDTQARVSRLPRPDRLLAETFARDGREHLCLWGFAGRNAHQTLGLLVTRRMEAAGLDPLGFVANDYALLIWGLTRVEDPAALLTPEGLREGLETWLGGNAVMKRTFRTAATIAGLIERNLPGRRRSGRQATFSSDILYDTLRKYDPDHLMLRITRAEAARGLVDFGRIEEMLARSAGRVDLVRAPHVTPLAAPLLLEVGKVPIKGQAEARLMREAADALLAEAGLEA